MSRLTDLVKGAVELNLRYTSTLLHLSKDYLKDAGQVLSQEPAANAPAPSSDAPASARAPLLIAGRSGDLANAAFAINNPADKEMSVHLIVQGELGDDRVRLDPARFTLAAGAGAIVRVLVPIDDKLEVGRDHSGQVVAPGLSSQGIPFIVRRLADVDEPSAPVTPAAKAPRSRRKAL